MPVKRFQRQSPRVHELRPDSGPSTLGQSRRCNEAERAEFQTVFKQLGVVETGHGLSDGIYAVARSSDQLQCRFSCHCRGDFAKGTKLTASGSIQGIQSNSLPGRFASLIKAAHTTQQVRP
jgi:hypothetical protein